MANTRVLRTYRYIDKNPVIDIIRTAIQDEGLIKKLPIVADLASLSRTTVPNWIHGDVRDPRHSSIMAVMTSLGYEFEWKKGRKLDFDKELEFARAWNKREKEKRVKVPRKLQQQRKAKKAKAKKSANG